MRRQIVLAAALLIGLVPNVQAVVNELSWTPNTEADLAGYKFYFSGGGTCPTGPLPPLLINGQQVILPKEAVKYTHTAPTVTGQWCYELTAFDTSGNESMRSNRALKVIDATAPAAPALRLGPVTP